MKGVVLRLDWTLAIAVLALVTLGTLLVWSATAERPGITTTPSTRWVLRHAASVLAGLASGVAVLVLGRDRLAALAPAGYLLALTGLAAVLIAGASFNGARSWIPLPFGASLQPAEPAKLAVVLALAAVFAREADAREPGRSARMLALATGAVPVLLVALQPDLGTAIVLALVTVSMLAIAGVRLRRLAAGCAAAFGCGVACLHLGLLPGYQVARITTFLHPGSDTDGAGYNAAQARAAVAGGGWTGHGLFHGPRTGGGFVPEQHTDFIFTVVGEELGFAGCAAVLVLVAAILWRGIRIAEDATDRFGRLVASGVVSWFAVQAFQGVGMTLGLTPVTGVPLPFLSYGGSAMVSCLLAVGVLQGVHLRTALPR